MNKEVLLVKKCQHCSNPMYVRILVDAEPVLVGCDAVIVDIRLDRHSDKEILIKGRRSQTTIRCTQCQKKHLLSSFDEVKDGVSRTQKGT